MVDITTLPTVPQTPIIRTGDSKNTQGEKSAAPVVAPENKPEAAGPVDKAKVEARAKATFDPTNDDILFLGLNKEAAIVEEKALKESLGKDGELCSIKNSSNSTVDGHDLKKPEGIKSFVDSLDLGSESAKEDLSRVLTDARKDARDELANIAKIWSQGEKGESVPSRLVLSGHSDGAGLISEDHQGALDFSDLRELARIFPEGAAQVEDIHIAACNSGFKANTELFKETFPNLKTFWAYSGTAPSTGTGAAAHLDRWEDLSCGREDNLDRVKDTSGLGVRGENIAVWSADGDYQANPKSMSATSSAEEMYNQYQSYANGERDLPSDPQSGPVKDLYDQLNREEGRLPLNSPDRDNTTGIKDRTLRLRFYDQMVSKNFQKVFGPELSKAYSDIGLTPPDFSKLSRKESLNKIAEFESKLSATIPYKDQTDDMRRATVLLGGLRDLSPTLMPSHWVERMNDQSVEEERLRSQNITMQTITENDVRNPEDVRLNPIRAVGGTMEDGSGSSKGDAPPGTELLGESTRG